MREAGQPERATARISPSPSTLPRKDLTMLCDYTKFTEILADLENAIREAALESRRDEETDSAVQMIEVLQ